MPFAPFSEGDDLAVDSAVHSFHFPRCRRQRRRPRRPPLAGGSGLVVLDAGLEGSQRGLVGHHLVDGVTAGVVKDAVADLEHIAGEEAVVHRDIQDDLGGVVQLADLFLIGSDPPRGGCGRHGGPFDDAVGLKELLAEFTCHFQPPLSPTGRPAGVRRPARSGCGPAASRTWRGPVRWSGRRPDAVNAGARPQRRPCPRLRIASACFWASASSCCLSFRPAVRRPCGELLPRHPIVQLSLPARRSGPLRPPPWRSRRRSGASSTCIWRCAMMFMTGLYRELAQQQKQNQNVDDCIQKVQIQSQHSSCLRDQPRNRMISRATTKPKMAVPSARAAPSRRLVWICRKPPAGG